MPLIVKCNALRCDNNNKAGKCIALEIDMQATINEEGFVVAGPECQLCWEEV